MRIYAKFWLVHWIVCVLCGWSEWLKLCFGFRMVFSWVSKAIRQWKLPCMGLTSLFVHCDDHVSRFSTSQSYIEHVMESNASLPGLGFFLDRFLLFLYHQHTGKKTTMRTTNRAINENRTIWSSVSSSMPGSSSWFETVEDWFCTETEQYVC